MDETKFFSATILHVEPTHGKSLFIGTDQVLQSSDFINFFITMSFGTCH